MSLATGRTLTPAPNARAVLVAALARVQGVTAHATTPDNPAAWDAFPRWALSDYRTGRLGMVGTHQYDVLVILPAGYEPDTVAEGDSLLDRVTAELAHDAEIQNADPIQLTFGNQTPMPALRIRVIPRVEP